MRAKKNKYFTQLGTKFIQEITKKSAFKQTK